MTYLLAAILAFVSYVGTVRVLRMTICSLGWHDFVKMLCRYKECGDEWHYHPVKECKYCGRKTYSR